MPANLTPQYRRAEEKYRRSQTPQARVECLQEMLRLIPKHKGTDRLQGELRARLKEAREELLSEGAGASSGRSFRIARQGAGTAVLIGAPNAGKSRLLSVLTGANPEVAPYPYTTREPQAGMMPWEDVRVQLIDTPPIAPHHVEPWLINLLRSADLAVLCFNGSDDDAPDGTRAVIDELRHRKVILSDVSGFDEDNFSIVHIKTILAVTHSTDLDVSLRVEMLTSSSNVPLTFPVLPVELETGEGVDSLRTSIGTSLPIMRIYTRKPGQARDPAPIVLPVGGCVEDLAEKIHHDLARQLKQAKVWSRNATMPRTVSRDCELSDGDLVELYC
jgi:ribosome-interacting GTPase 1